MISIKNRFTVVRHPRKLSHYILSIFIMYKNAFQENRRMNSFH